MFDPETHIKDQDSQHLRKLHDSLIASTLVIPGPFLKIFNRQHIVLEPHLIIDRIEYYVSKLQSSEKFYVKDPIALGWFVDACVLILHLTSKHQSFVGRMLGYYTKVFEFRKIKSLYNQKIKEVIIIKGFCELCFLQTLIEKKQYLQLDSEAERLIKCYGDIDQPVLKIVISHLDSIKFALREISLKKLTDKEIYRAVENRKIVITGMKCYFDRTALTFFISDTINMAIKIFQSTPSLSLGSNKGHFVKRLCQDIITRDVFGDTAMKSLKIKYQKILSAELDKEASKAVQEIFKSQQKRGRHVRPMYPRNTSCNSFIYQTPEPTKFHKQSHQSLHRYHSDQKSVLRYLLCSQEKKKVVKQTTFNYNCIKQNQSKPVKNELSVQALESEISQIVRSETYAKKSILSFNSFKVRKNNSLLTRRLKRISMVLQEQNLSECEFASPLKFSKHLCKQVCSVEVLFLVGRDSGSIQLVIRQPNKYCQLSIFSIKSQPNVNTGVLINRYKQELESSIYYYEFFDGVRDEIESTDVVDMMLSELILEYEGRIERKLLSNYMLIKQYVSKYFHWRHLRAVNKISGFTYKLISIPQIPDFLKFSLYLQNVIKSNPVISNNLGKSKSRMKKSMYPILEYLSDSQSIILKSIKNIGPHYYMDILVSNKENIDNIQMIEGQVEIQNIEYSVETYSIKTLSKESTTQPFRLKQVDGKEIIKRLIFTGYISKWMINRLREDLGVEQIKEFSSGEKLPAEYRRSLVEEERITLLDEDLKFDERYSTPKLTQGIKNLMSARGNNLSIVSCLLEMVLKESLKQIGEIEYKIQYQQTKYYRHSGYCHIVVKQQTEKSHPRIQFRVTRAKRANSTIFVIYKTQLQQMFPTLQYQQIIKHLALINCSQYPKLLLSHNNSYIQSLKQHKNTSLFVYRRKICSKVIRSPESYCIVSVYCNSITKGWEIEVFDQKTKIMKVGFINVFQLGIICMSQSVPPINLMDPSWLIYLVNPSCFMREEELRIWLQLLDDVQIRIYEDYVEICQVIVYVQVELRSVGDGRRCINVYLERGECVEDSTFAIYGFQEYQCRLAFYSSISYAKTKQLYMLDHYYHEEISVRERLNRLAEYISNKINNNEYEQEIYVYNEQEHITYSVEVMEKINCQRNLKIASKRRSGIYFNLDQQLIELIHQSTLGDYQKIEVGSIIFKYWSIDDKVLVWIEYLTHFAAIVTHPTILSNLTHPTYADTIQKLLLMS